MNDDQLDRLVSAATVSDTALEQLDPAGLSGDLDGHDIRALDLTGQKVRPSTWRESRLDDVVADGANLAEADKLARKAVAMSPAGPDRAQILETIAGPQA